MSELEQLVDDLGRRSFEARLGQRGLPDAFDEALWRNLEETGLSRLTSRPRTRARPRPRSCCAGLARYAAAVPIAETDLLAAWLARTAGVAVPDTGPLTVAIADADVRDGRVAGPPATCRGRAATRCAGRAHRRRLFASRSPMQPTSSTATTWPASRAARSPSTWPPTTSQRSTHRRRRRADPPRRVGALCSDHRRARCGRAT